MHIMPIASYCNIKFSPCRLADDHLIYSTTSVDRVGYFSLGPLNCCTLATDLLPILITFNIL